MKIVIKSRIKLDLCRHGHYMRNDIINAEQTWLSWMGEAAGSTQEIIFTF